HTNTKHPEQGWTATTHTNQKSHKPSTHTPDKTKGGRTDLQLASANTRHRRPVKDHSATSRSDSRSSP
ncbi:hypothetical protein ABT289_29660, partial [Streptomyces fimicarius]|uniref:hypothetical protein n=1 Tax=Streptomyces griseus TaxID=1911 RepID=UPI00331CD619